MLYAHCQYIKGVIKHGKGNIFLKYRNYYFRHCDYCYYFKGVEKVKYFYNYSKLLGRLREMGLTQSELAEKIGISDSSLNHSLNNKRSFRQSEITSVCDYLSIPNEKIEAYFFVR